MRSLSSMGLATERDFILVVDQTFADASVTGAGADDTTFQRMLAAAIDESGGRRVVVKVHPETVSGHKQGYLTAATRGGQVDVVAELVNPWALIEHAAALYTVSSQLGLEALLAGRRVVCFGAAMYAGLGLTDDRFDRTPLPPTRRAVSLDDLTAATYFDYCRWLDPYRLVPTTFEHAADILTLWRDRYLGNTRSTCIGFTRWKRRAVRDFLRGIDGDPQFHTRLGRPAAGIAGSDRLIVWGNRAPATRTQHGDERNVITCEDGLLRSVGLGAMFTRPLSLVFDDLGIYYDPTRPSRFEHLASQTDFDAPLLARARALRTAIVDNGLSKYNDTTARDTPVIQSSRHTILVPGQVEGDASIVLGSPVVQTNLHLLQAVRQRWPDAQLVYKPHPDVEAGLRRGAVPTRQALAYADRVVTRASITALLQEVDHVETMTSLAGFEALLRGRSVTTHGLPFYAGWGLTEDLRVAGRRTRRLTLDELVAVALILYPQYIDPVLRLPCEAELIIERLIEARARQLRLPGKAALLARRAYAVVAHKSMQVLGKRA
jgi:capsular polysaccharide export protein